MFLTLEKFLDHFKFSGPKPTKAQFAKKFTVTYSTPQTFHQIFALKGKKPIIKSKDDKRYKNRHKIIEYFYEIIIRNREKYLSLFYNAYFSFKDPTTLKWSGIDLNLNNEVAKTLDAPLISVQKNDASRRIIRNLFYMEILHLTRVVNTVKSKVSFWESLVNMYNKLQLEDRMFAPSSLDLFLREKGTKREQLSGIREVNYHNLFYLLQAYQPKASIFNPYAIKWIMDNILAKKLGRSPKTIFTPVLSWASYLVAFMHVPSYQHYVGVDVMPSVCQKNRDIAKWYNKSFGPDDPAIKKKKVDIYCTPSEKLLKNRSFLKKYNKYFDTVLICPPYFNMESYHEGDQSIKNYPNYHQWLENYWEKTVQVVKRVINKDGIFAVIINDYNTLDGESFPLSRDVKKITSKYFRYDSKFYLQNRTSPLRAAAKDRMERMLIFKN